MMEVTTQKAKLTDFFIALICLCHFFLIFLNELSQRMTLRLSTAGLMLKHTRIGSTPLRYITSYPSIRSQSSSSTTTPSPSPESNIPPHRRNTGPPSNHKLFYRDIVPPLFRVLAYGSAVFLSLQLIWQYLDGLEQKKLEEQVRTEMEAQVRQKLENRGVAKSDIKAQGKSWWSWLGGSSSSQQTEHKV
jgi:hypothetical protein